MVSNLKEFDDLVHPTSEGKYIKVQVCFEIQRYNQNLIFIQFIV